MSPTMYILRLLRVLAVLVFAAAGLTMSCRCASAQTQTVVEIDAAQWADLIDAVSGSSGTYPYLVYGFYEGGQFAADANWLKQIKLVLSGMSSMTSNKLGELDFNLEQIHDDLWDTIAGQLNDLANVNVEGFSAVDDRVWDVEQAVIAGNGILTNIAESVVSIEDDTGNLASWGTPDTGPGIRVQIAGTPSVDAVVNMSGSYPVSGYTGGTTGSEVAYPIYGTQAVAQYEGIIGQTNWFDSGLPTISTNGPSGAGISGRMDLGLTPSQTYIAIDKPWSDFGGVFSGETNHIYLELDWHDLYDDAEFWALWKRNLSIAYLVCCGIVMFNLYRTMG